MLLAGLALAGCGSAADGKLTAPSASKPPHWATFVRALCPLDLAGPRTDGSLVLAAHGRLEHVADGPSEAHGEGHIAFLK